MKRYLISKFMGKNPTKIGQISDVTFYEHPIHGKDAGLVAVWNMCAFQTDFYDLPDLIAVESLKNDFVRGI